MTDIKELAKQVSIAWENKDESALRALLHDDYYFKGPHEDLNGPDECIEFMKNFPFKGRTENAQFIAEDNKVVHVSDWIVTAPFSATIPMVMVMEFDDSKLKKETLFFDTAKMPAQ